MRGWLNTNIAVACRFLGCRLLLCMQMTVPAHRIVVACLTRHDFCQKVAYWNWLIIDWLGWLELLIMSLQTALSGFNNPVGCFTYVTPECLFIVFQCIWRGSIPHTPDPDNCRSHLILLAGSSCQHCVHCCIYWTAGLSYVACSTDVTCLGNADECHAAPCHFTGWLLSFKFPFWFLLCFTVC